MYKENIKGRKPEEAKLREKSEEPQENPKLTFLATLLPANLELASVSSSLRISCEQMPCFPQHFSLCSMVGLCTFNSLDELSGFKSLERSWQPSNSNDSATRQGTIYMLMGAPDKHKKRLY